MSKTPDQETPKELNLDKKTNQIDQKKSLKKRSFWRKTLRVLGKYAFLSFAKTLEYFVNRARFGLMAVLTFNIVLIAFVFSEWFVYYTFFTIFLPNSIQDLFQNL